MSSLENESWRIISGFERYSVSDLGRIRNDWTGRILRPRISNHGTNKHAKVVLSFAGYKKDLFVHRLVVEGFIRELKNGEIVNHKDGIQTNNRVENLEICDISANARHSLELRNKLSRIDAAFLPVENSLYKGLFVSLEEGQRDDGLFDFLRSRGFQCLECWDRKKLRSLVIEYLNS